MPTAPLSHKARIVRPKDSRPSAAKRGYGRRWQTQSKIFLRKNPLCAECSRNGIVRVATVVDHIVPHKGDYKLFWDRTNWQSACKLCHDRKTGKEVKG